MAANLIQSLQEIRDFRASQGKRYPKKVNFAFSDYGNDKWMHADIKHWKTLG